MQDAKETELNKGAHFNKDSLQNKIDS